MSQQDPQPRVVVRRADRPGDLGWVVMAHGEVYDQQFGWDTDFEALVAKIVADFAADHDPVREAAWIAEVDGERAGCIFLVASDEPRVAKLRILLVTPTARGLGVGTRLVGTCLAFARDAGYGQVTLWTNDVLASARRIYEAFGFTLTDEQPHHSFGHDLIGQNWTLELDQSPAAAPQAQVTGHDNFAPLPDRPATPGDHFHDPRVIPEMATTLRALGEPWS